MMYFEYDEFNFQRNKNVVCRAKFWPVIIHMPLPLPTAFNANYLNSKKAPSYSFWTRCHKYFTFFYARRAKSEQFQAAANEMR
jgi:hypothetical protein